MNCKLTKIMVLCLMFFCSMKTFANTDSRHWTMATGEKIYAELVTYDPASKIAILRKNDLETRYAVEEFSKIDIAWLVEWAEFSEELEKLKEKVKGEFNHYQSEGKYPSDFYVYTPSKYKDDQKLPLLFLFHPSGKGARYVKRMMLSAESLGMIVISSDAFYNTGTVWSEKDVAMFEVFKELWGIIEDNIPHDPTKVYLGGSSGGAMLAYQYSGMVKRPWAGIWANGGWLGGPKYYDREYGKNMRVAIVNGNQDHSVNRQVKGDTGVFERNGCTVELFLFEGGHQVPPPMIQYKSLLWMLDIPNPDSRHIEKK